MTQRPPSFEDPGRYEIRVRGHLDTRWAAWFDGLTLTHTTDGITVLHGLIVDQAALHGRAAQARRPGPDPALRDPDARPRAGSHPDRPLRRRSP